MLMKAEASQLLIVDVQERLTPVMSDPRRVIMGCVTLLKAARRLLVPVLVSEQYPKGLGPTIFDLREFVPEGARLAKLHFSCIDDPDIAGRIAAHGRPQVVLAGIEAHVCILQTALGLKEQGYEVFVAADASASRHAGNEEMAWRRLSQAGIAPVSLEMVLFEWLNRAGTQEFKELSGLIR